MLVGLRWIGASNKSGVVENCVFASCGRYIFRNFIYETKIIMSEYVVLNGFSSTSKQMTLSENDLEEPFCVKYCFLSGIV